MGISGSFDRLGRLPYSPTVAWKVTNMPIVDGQVVPPAYWTISVEGRLDNVQIPGSECEYEIVSDGVICRYRFERSFDKLGTMSVAINDSHFESVS